MRALRDHGSSKILCDKGQSGYIDQNDGDMKQSSEHIPAS